MDDSLLGMGLAQHTGASSRAAAPAPEAKPEGAAPTGQLGSMSAPKPLGAGIGQATLPQSTVTAPKLLSAADLKPSMGPEAVSPEGPVALAPVARARNAPPIPPPRDYDWRNSIVKALPPLTDEQRQAALDKIVRFGDSDRRALQPMRRVAEPPRFLVAAPFQAAVDAAAASTLRRRSAAAQPKAGSEGGLAQKGSGVPTAGTTPAAGGATKLPEPELNGKGPIPASKPVSRGAGAQKSVAKGPLGSSKLQKPPAQPSEFDHARAMSGLASKPRKAPQKPPSSFSAAIAGQGPPTAKETGTPKQLPAPKGPSGRPGAGEETTGAARSAKGLARKGSALSEAGSPFNWPRFSPSPVGQSGAFSPRPATREDLSGDLPAQKAGEARRPKELRHGATGLDPAATAKDRDMLHSMESEPAEEKIPPPAPTVSGAQHQKAVQATVKSKPPPGTSEIAGQPTTATQPASDPAVAQPGTAGPTAPTAKATMSSTGPGKPGGGGGPAPATAKPMSPAAKERRADGANKSRPAARPGQQKAAGKKQPDPRKRADGGYTRGRGRIICLDNLGAGVTKEQIWSELGVLKFQGVVVSIFIPEFCHLLNSFSASSKLAP